LLKLALTASVAIAALTGPALATTYTITAVTASYPDNSGVILIPDLPPPPWTTPMALITNTAQSIEVYCADLFHNTLIEGGQDLTYQTAPVTTNGNGVALTEAQSNIMGQLTRIGLDATAHGDTDLSIAAQAAVWATEPGTGPVTSPDPTIESELTKLLATTHDNGTGFANGLVSLNGAQGMILPSAAAPELSTWVLLSLGLLALAGKLAHRKLVRA
jgi:hypothetical protein